MNRYNIYCKVQATESDPIVVLCQIRPLQCFGIMRHFLACQISHTSVSWSLTKTYYRIEIMTNLLSTGNSWCLWVFIST